MKEKTNIFDSVSFWILAGVTFLMPLFFLPNSWSGIAGAKMTLFGIGTLLALIAFVVDRIRKGSVSIQTRPVYAFFILIPLAYLASAFMSISQYKSFMGGGFDMDTLNFVALSMIFALLVSAVAKTPKRIGILLFSFCLSVVLAALLQIVRVFAGDVFSFGVLSLPALTVAGRWNDLVCLLLVFLGILLIYLETAKLKRGASICLAALIVLPFLFFSLSSIAFDFYFWICTLPIFLCISALLVFAYIFTLKKSKQIESASAVAASGKISSRMPLPSLVFLVLSVCLVLFAKPIGNFLVQQTGVAYSESALTWQATYGVASRTVPQNPFFGTGPNTFSNDWNAVKPPAVNSYVFWNEDVPFGVGIVPTTIVSVGSVGFVLWLVFYALILIIAVRMLFFSKASSDLPAKATISFSVLLSSFLMFFYSPGQAFVFAHFLFIGLLLAVSSSSKKSFDFSLNASQSRHFLATFAGIIIAIASVFWGWSITSKVIAVHEANLAVTSSDPDQALVHINQAISLNPGFPAFYQIASEVYLAKIAKIAALGASVVAARAAEVQADVSAAISNSLLAEAADPTDWRSRVVTGRVLDYLGSLGISDAIKQSALKYKSASDLSPSNPLPYIFKANAYLALHDPNSAKEALVQAITLKSDWSDAPAMADAIRTLIAAINKAGAPQIAPAPQATSTDQEVTKPAAKSKK
ncbi:MAG: hypothetical protein V4438_01280 [Patescibacteria group bacterium]